MKKILISSLCFLSLVLIICASAVGYAYFSKYDIYQGILGAEVELLFDRLNDTGLAAYKNADGVVIGDKEADWGTEENPYVISNIKHLYNLATLQKLGYFETHFISDNYTLDSDGNKVYAEPEGGWSMPYFLVCTPEGTPVTIDGTTFSGTIATIGTEEYPFVGSVKGAFVDGECTVGGRTADTSAIYNITVTGDPGDVDVGLFGYIGVLGEIPEDDIVTDADGEVSAATFNGQISEISDLLLYDVTVSVQNSVWSTIEKTLDEFLLSHVFSFESLTADEQARSPHENHHIGILAGHVCYAKIEYISVYYSNDEMVAIDLSDTYGWQFSDSSIQAANYMSASGIIGYVDNLNPTIEGGIITAGTGTSNGNLAYSPVGGGGLLSGNKAGYVLASNMYETYHWTNTGTEQNPVYTEDATGTVFIKDALTSDGTPLCEEWVRDRILWGTENTGEYYFWDGVFTFALSTQQDIIEPTWNSMQDMMFSIGSTNTDDWAVNYSKGNNAVVAFIKQIKSDAALQEAIENGKQIFILTESGEQINLMNLYNISNGGSGEVEEKFTVPSGSLNYASDAFINQIIESYEGMTAEQIAEMFSEMNDAYDTPDELISVIDKTKTDTYDDEFKVINVGITSSSISLNDLKSQYKITADEVENTYQLFDLSGNPLTPTEEGIQDYYDYTAGFDKEEGATNTYQGYFYFKIISGGGLFGTTKGYEYHWFDFETGTDIIIRKSSPDLFSDDDMTPYEYFTNTDNGTTLVGTWQGENLYSRSVTINGTAKTVTGIVIHIDNNTIFNGDTTYTDDSKVSVNTGNVVKPMGDPVKYFYQPVGSDKWYYSENNEEVTLSENSIGTSAGGRELFEGTTSNNVIYTGMKLKRYAMYTFSNASNFMTMLKLYYRGGTLGSDLGTYYPLWNGPKSIANVDTANTNSNFVHDMGWPNNNCAPYVQETTVNAVLKFNDSDGTCYISYTIGNVTRYINYLAGTGYGTATTNASDTTKLYIYSVEGTQDLNYGRVTFEPKQSTGGESFGVDTHVLYANTTAINGIVNGTGEFSVVSLEDLGWNNGKSNVLSAADLQKKFHLMEGISFGMSFNILNGSLNFGSSGGNGFLQAPVGSLGIEANIPSGCVAFRINKADGDKKIRVIVAVPTSEYHQGETVGTTTIEFPTYNRYFNLWQLDEAGEDWLQVFSADDYLARFSLPMSYPYEPGKQPNEGTYITVNKGSVSFNETTGATNVTPGATDYYCSLNGDRVLVAYEFTVTEAMGAGIYVLGMSGYEKNDDGTESDTAVNNVPMEIVYFSADGVASNGRDGDSGSQMGTIDYVYHYEGDEPILDADGTQTGTQAVNKIVTVKDSSSTDDEGNEQYYGYYPSYVIMYFNNGKESGNSAVNNGFVLVGEEKVRLRRWVMNEDGTVADISTMTFNKNGTNHTEISTYARLADALDIIAESASP